MVFAMHPDGMAKGSARSVEGMSLVNILSECQEHVVRFGGHAMAAGATVRLDQYEQFRAAFRRAAERSATPEALSRAIAVEAAWMVWKLLLENGLRRRPSPEDFAA
jgi:single-stranded DNA-specific DHH superfamily exonuclease